MKPQMPLDPVREGIQGECTGVPITQPEKIILIYKSFFLIFKNI
jgi:hypothetical protein